MKTIMNEPLHIKGDCKVADLSEADRARLVSVSGKLHAYRTTDLVLPALEKCGWLEASESTGLSLPALVSVADEIFACDSTGLNLPKLSTCGKVDAYRSTDLSLPNLATCGTLFADESTGLALPKLVKCGKLDAERSTGLTLPALVSVTGRIYSAGATELVISDKLARQHNIPDSVRAKK